MGSSRYKTIQIGNFDAQPLYFCECLLRIVHGTLRACIDYGVYDQSILFVLRGRSSATQGWMQSLNSKKSARDMTRECLSGSGSIPIISKFSQPA